MTVYTLRERSQAVEESLIEIARIADSAGIAAAVESRKYSLAKLQGIADQVRPNIEKPFFNGDVVGTQIDMDENVVTISVPADKVEAAKGEVERTFGDAARVVEGSVEHDA